MQVVRYSTLEELTHLARDWDGLSQNVPFRGWAWASTWWRHYGAGKADRQQNCSLYVLVAQDNAGKPVGIAPWYCDPSAAQGRVLRFLGSGEVCSDHLSVLCHPGNENAVGAAMAEWLASDRTAACEPDRWDLLELTGVDASDRSVSAFVEHLQSQRLSVHRRPGPNGWRLNLPASWQDYLQTLSKDHRKQLRRIDRKAASFLQIKHRFVEDEQDLATAREILVDLHQRRRQSLGEPGCFASPEFTAFHREVMWQLLAAGQLRLEWIEMNGRPIAAEYQLSGAGVLYAYQSGVDPNALKHSPGRACTLFALRRAIEQGYHTYDLLRGDEGFKAHWRAKAYESVEIRAAAPRASSRIRHALWLAGSGVKHWLSDTLRVPASAMK
jgi:CelD/BcsL family acetyltransferase involved in cellulose biosynthesis